MTDAARQPSLWDQPPPYQRGSATSREAAEAIRDVVPQLRRDVLAAYRQAGAAGLTADEAATVLRRSVLAIRPRVTEAVQAGLLERTGERRKNRSGMSASVLRVSAKGVEQ